MQSLSVENQRTPSLSKRISEIGLEESPSSGLKSVIVFFSRIEIFPLLHPIHKRPIESCASAVTFSSGRLSKPKKRLYRIPSNLNKPLFVPNHRKPVLSY